MEIATIDYQGELHCTARHLRSSKEIETDAPLDNNGRGEAFSPTDLLATSLGLCMITIMGIKARDMGLDISGTKISVDKTMANDPRRVSAIRLVVSIPHNHSEKDRTILERAGLACPVAKSLKEDVQQNVKFEWGK